MSDTETISRSETVAEIAREIRNYFDLLNRGLIADSVQRMTTRKRYSFWADRLEAAAKRERAAFDTARKVAKDTAEQYRRLYEKKREVEERLAEIEEQRPIISPEPGNVAALREALEKGVELWLGRNIEPDDCRTWLDSAKAALAAPARNVDRFRTSEEAQKAWAEYNRYYGPFEYWAMAAIAWLFEPALPEDKQKSCPS